VVNAESLEEFIPDGVEPGQMKYVEQEHQQNRYLDPRGEFGVVGSVRLFLLVFFNKRFLVFLEIPNVIRREFFFGDVVDARLLVVHIFRRIAAWHISGRQSVFRLLLLVVRH
jgi:hypothetical protein